MDEVSQIRLEVEAAGGGMGAGEVGVFEGKENLGGSEADLAHGGAVAQSAVGGGFLKVMGQFVVVFELPPGFFGFVFEKGSIEFDHWSAFRRVAMNTFF